MKTLALTLFVFLFLIETAIAGSKPVILYLHGGSVSSDSFLNMVGSSRLQNYADVMVGAPVGTGGSKNSGKQASFDQQLADVEKQIGKIPKDQPIVLFGFSSGSILAMKLAEKYPKRFARLVIASGMYNPATGDHGKILQNVGADMKKIEAQTILLHGRADKVVPESDLNYADIGKFHPTIYRRAGKGHNLIIEDQDFVLSVLESAARQTSYDVEFEESNKRFFAEPRKVKATH